MIPVQFITHTTERYTYEDAARLALDGGCRWVQLRMKDCPPGEVEETARNEFNVDVPSALPDEPFVIKLKIEKKQSGKTYRDALT